jgi:hypothetical protein
LSGHRLSIEQLREVMERWCGHRWSPQSDQQVFSSSGVHQLMSGHVRGVLGGGTRQHATAEKR